MKNCIGILVFFLVLFLSACDYEAEMLPKTYPLIKTESVDAGWDNSRFIGTIQKAGTLPIRYYGFVWSTHVNPDLSDHQYLTSGNPSPSTYTCLIEDGLTATNYWYRAVVITDSAVVYGQSLSFKNKFNSKQIVYGFSSTKGYPGDVITITGKNFLLDGFQVAVYIEKIKVNIDSISNTQLFVKVPNSLMHQKVRLDVLYPIENSLCFIGNFEIFPRL
jgi:hypothetical protein